MLTGVWNLTVVLLPPRENNEGRLTAAVVGEIEAETSWSDKTATPLLDLLLLVVNVIENPAARETADGRAALHGVDIFLDTVAVYQEPA
ncbi:hypothetical protein [Streptomyces sp. NPDC055607]